MLTSAELVDTRRFLGYSVSGDSAFFPFREVVFSNVSYMGMDIDTRLANLTSDEENILRTVYLTNLTTLEVAIVGASCNLATDSAAVWKHNANEVNDRKNLFNYWRTQMADFLGFKPGKGVGGNGLQISRC